MLELQGVTFDKDWTMTENYDVRLRRGRQLRLQQGLRENYSEDYNKRLRRVL